MNHIIHNISLIILALGIIMMTVYVTKASSNGFLTYEQRLMSEQRMKLRSRIPEQSIYDYRITKEYKNMFAEPSIWLGYQTFDPEDIPQKLYIN